MYLLLATAAAPFGYCILFFFCHHLIIASVKGGSVPAPDFLGNVAINCGSRSNSAGLDGREWIAETQGLEPKGTSTTSRIVQDKSFHADPIPYMTARISTTEFSYTFQVNPGQKFVRLHFYPSSYRRFEKSQDLFTVYAGPFTLLKNFSASLAADAFGVNYLVKEFCLNVEENNRSLSITFSPSESGKPRKSYAFVNGIEIISMPTGLYYTHDADSGAQIVGRKNRFYLIDNSTALELVQRLNIGGNYIPPGEDFGMFRSWDMDAKYLLTSGLQPLNHFVYRIKFTSIPAFAAPLKIYQTSWGTRKMGGGDKMHNFTWKIPVDVGFEYFVRLHFCGFELEMTGDGQIGFTVLINNQVGETMADVTRLSSETGIPIYRDYMVIVKGDGKGGKFDLFIELQSSDELVVGIFHGLEIFKLSNPDNNLASPFHMHQKQVSTSWGAKIQNWLLAIGTKNAIAAVMTVLIMLLNIIVFKLRQIWVRFGHEEKQTKSATREQPCYQFSLAEIISATRNFSDELLIGRGGFGSVYKGFIRGGSEVVAVKRLKSNSKQGAHEFWTEIETLSKIRHVHLVSLLGYCNEYLEMILFYEYMPRGTLADNLYKIGRDRKDGTSPLTWEQRLRICIGTARGIDYLHTGIKYGAIHRDVKDSNILLDENLVAKVSDFGLSKLGNVSESLSSVSTKVKGTWGYLDPDYLITQKLTTKTDVYAFGVVLLVVLSGKPAVTRNAGEPKTLISFFRECSRKGEIDDIIDLSLRGKISSGSLSKFLTSIECCLQEDPRKRPTMAQVVASLECAVEEQKIIPPILDSEIYVDRPFEVESLQSAQFIMSMASPLLEESDTVKDPVEVKPRGEMVHAYMPKPLWRSAREALRYRVNPMKGKDLVSDKARDSVALLDGSPADLSCGAFDKPIEFSYGELANATSNFSICNQIGEGIYGVVYYAELRGERAAIKKMHEQATREFLAELKFSTHIHHRNLVRLIGYCVEGSLFLVYEYIENGSLSQHLLGRKPLPWSTMVRIALESARALSYIHENTVPTYVHCDIKSANILIDKSFSAKVASFGSVKQYEVGSSSWCTRPIINSGYTAPEYAQYGEVSPKIDVFSFGIVLSDLISAAKEAIVMESSGTPRGLVELSQLEDFLGKVADARLGDGYSIDSLRKMAHLAKICSHENPQLRPTFTSIVLALEEL